jgi:hypothetical protein
MEKPSGSDRLHCGALNSGGGPVLIESRGRRYTSSSLGLLCATAIIAGNANRAAAYDDSAFHEIETKYIFGFTVGSTIGLEGEKAFEPETFANFGKRTGSYAVTKTELEFEFTPNQYVQIELGPTVSYYNIANVTGLDDRNAAKISGFEANFRYLILDRQPSLPLAVTLSAEPEFHSTDETNGQKVVNYGIETKIEADIELVKNRLFLGMNLLYEPETTRVNLGTWENESTLGASTALAFQIVPGVVIGAEVWYLRHYDGLGSTLLRVMPSTPDQFSTSISHLRSSSAQLGTLRSLVTRLAWVPSI